MRSLLMSLTYTATAPDQKLNPETPDQNGK